MSLPESRGSSEGRANGGCGDPVSRPIVLHNLVRALQPASTAPVIRSVFYAWPDAVHPGNPSRIRAARESGRRRLRRAG